MGIRSRVANYLRRRLAVPASHVPFGANPFEKLYFSSVGRRRSQSGGLGIVFSMDRAFQLHSLLSSYYEKVQDPVPLKVIYRATTPEHLQAYEQVFKEFKSRPVTPMLQSTKEVFKRLVLSGLSDSTAGWVFFLVDDIVFIDNLNLSEFAQYDLRDFVPSMRLSKHLTRCFTMNQAQKLPAWIGDPRLASGHNAWLWSAGEYDWGYPLSVDGHLFDREEILEVSRNTDFFSPNTYEGHLQKFVPYFSKRLGVCFERSKIVNLAINKVQTDNFNLHGDIHQNDLLKAWNEGKQMDFRRFYGIQNESAHIDADIHFIARN